MSHSAIMFLVRSERNRRGWSGRGSSGTYDPCNPTHTRASAGTLARIDPARVDSRVW